MGGRGSAGWGLLAVLAGGVLFLTACNYVEPAGMTNNTENFFWVTINDEKIRDAYKVVRLSLVNQVGTQLVVSTGPFEEKFKVVPPPAEDLTSEDGTAKVSFLVELKTRYPMGDHIKILAPNAMALGFLSSRFIEIPEDSLDAPPTPGSTVTLTLEVSDIFIGYGPGSLTVADIPGIPPFFVVNIDLSGGAGSTIGQYLDDGYTPMLGIAMGRTSFGDNPPLDIDFTKYPPISEDDVLGISSPDTGWYMLMNKDNAPAAGTPCRYWIFFTRNNDMSTMHLYYEEGEIPATGGTVTVSPTFAGIPVPNAEALVMLSMPDAARQPPYASLAESYVLTAPLKDDYGSGYSAITLMGQWAPIGRSGGNGYSEFTGLFDGGGYVIYDFPLETVTAITYAGHGLFGSARNAIFQNINMPNTNVVPPGATVTVSNGVSASNIGVGWLVGVSQSCTFTNVSTNGALKAVYSGSTPFYLGGVGGFDAASTITATTGPDASLLTRDSTASGAKKSPFGNR